MSRKKIIFNKGFFLILIFFIFQSNLFYAAGSKNFFNLVKTNSEIEVTDGILNGIKTNKYNLGTYDRGDDRSSNSYDYKKQFSESDNNYFFQRYTSSYGLNVKVYGFLHKHFNLSINQLNSINALIFSFFLIFFYELLKKKFCRKSSFFFSTVLVLSPWSIIYASELRYVGWSFFLPSLILCFYENINKKNIFNFFCLCFCLFISILIKCLITYEYLSTIMSMPFILFLYFRIKESEKIKIIFVKSIAISFFLFLGFVVSVLMHLHSLKLENFSHSLLINRININLGLVKDGNNEIFCQKDFNIGSPIITNRIRSEDEIKTCLLERDKLEKISRFDVIKKYFFFRNFLPFLGNYENQIDSNLKLDLKNLFNSKEFIKEVQKKNNITNLINSFPLLISVIFFLVFILINVFFVIKNYKKVECIVIIGSFLSSVSFFLIVKNWSYIHTHLAFICWIISFIPFSTLIITNHINQNSKL